MEVVPITAQMFKEVIFVPVFKDTHCIPMEEAALVRRHLTVCDCLAVDTIDNNECANNDTNDCNQICSNTAGSYVCYCNSGYELGLDDATCVGKTMY